MSTSPTRTRGRYSRDATLARLRSACCDASPVSADAQAELVATIVLASRSAQRVEEQRARARRVLERRAWR